MDSLKNTGSEIATKSSPFRISLDWLAFTFHDPNLSECEQLAGFRERFPFIENYFTRDHRVLAASNHFEYMIRLADGVLLSWDICQDKGVNLSVSGSHLGLFYDWFPELLNEPQPFRKLLYILEDNYCRPSRVDIAFDDFDKIFVPYDFLQFNYNEQIITPYRSARLESSRINKGTTYQLGKRSSGSHLRIYEKDKESNGEVDAIRYEYELHGSTCRDFCSAYREYGLINFRAFFERYLKIVQKKETVKRKSNLPYDEAWESFLNLKFNEQLGIEVMPHKVDSRPERVLKTAIMHLKGVMLYCSSIPKDVLYHLISELQYNFTDKDFEKLKFNADSLCRFFNYDEGVIL